MVGRPNGWRARDERPEEFKERLAAHMREADAIRLSIKAELAEERRKSEQERIAREAAELLERNTRELESLLAGGFVKFAQRLGVTLSPAQMVLCAVCFDGAQPDSLDGAESALFETMFGPIQVVDASLLRWLVWVIGGRSGKSYLGALALLYRSLVSDLSSLAAGEDASALVVCPRLELAIHTLKFISGACKKHPLLKTFIRTDTTDVFVIERPDNYRVSFEAMPATSGGGAVRARTLVAAMLDEVAFFRDKEYAVNDRDIYQAAEPRVTIPGGFILVSSTPWAEGGLLFDEYEANMGHPTTGICANVSTSLMRSDNPTILKAVENARKKDPRNAEREFDAKFSATVSTLYFPGVAIEACWQHGQSIIPVQDGSYIWIVVDAAFSVDSNDRFGWAVVTSVASRYQSVGPNRRERRVTTVHECGAWQVDRKPREMAIRLRDEVCVRYGTQHIIIDQFSDRAFQQLCSDVGIIADIVHWKGGEMEDSKAERYRMTRTAMLTEHLLLCDQSDLRRDLAACRSKLLPGGGEQIGVPQTRRGHGDVLSAAVLGISQAMLSPGVLQVPEAPEDAAARLELETRERRRREAEKRARRGSGRW